MSSIRLPASRKSSSTLFALTATAPAEAAQPAFSPLYQQIKALLLRSLQGGEWKPGEAIPSELELAARFGVSQGTVRKAIDELAIENLLVRRQGRGTFVATHAEETTRYRFLRLAPDDAGEDGESGRLRRRLLECRRLKPPADVEAALALDGGAQALRVRRLLLEGDRPVVHDDIWLPAGLFKGLTAERLAGYRGAMYAFFETEFGVRMIRAEEKLRAVAATPEVAEVMNLPEGAPLLSVERLSFTYGDKPVELRRGLYDTRAHHYRNELG